MIPASLLPALPRTPLPLPEAVARPVPASGTSPTPAGAAAQPPTAAPGFAAALPLPLPAETGTPAERADAARPALTEGAAGAGAAPQTPMPAPPASTLPTQTLVAQMLIAQMTADGGAPERGPARSAAHPRAEEEARRPADFAAPTSWPEVERRPHGGAPAAAATPAGTARADPPGAGTEVAGPDPRLLPPPPAPAPLPPATLWGVAGAILAALVLFAAFWG